MGTFLFDKLIFGPVQSRRLGLSLGINLLPTKQKVCNFDCAYCECGLTGVKLYSGNSLPNMSEVINQLQDYLEKCNNYPESITFAGNGEPTLHPQFAEIVKEVSKLRDIYCPETKLTVLSNALLADKKRIRDALLQVDRNVLKLDAAVEETFLRINRPLGKVALEDVIQTLESYGEQCIIQTLFFRGAIEEQIVDNTTPKELEALLAVYMKVQPQEVMIYSIQRDTPFDTLEAVEESELLQAADFFRRSGIKILVTP